LSSEIVESYDGFWEKSGETIDGAGASCTEHEWEKLLAETGVCVEFLGGDGGDDDVVGHVEVGEFTSDNVAVVGEDAVDAWGDG